MTLQPIPLKYRNKGKTIDHVAMAKVMGYVNRGEPVPDELRPKERAPRGATGPHKHPEADIRNAIFENLKGDGCVIYRIENAFDTGLADALVFRPKIRLGKFMEVKVPGKEKKLLSVRTDDWRIRPKRKAGTAANQEYFRWICLVCGWPHCVVTSVNEARKEMGLELEEESKGDGFGDGF